MGMRRFLKSITARFIDSESATDGYVLKADGASGSAWEALTPTDIGFESVDATLGWFGNYPLQSLSISYVDGGTNILYADIEATGGGNVTVYFNGTLYTLDCTTGAGAGGKARVTLTAGTGDGTAGDTISENYIYLTPSAGTTAVLAASTAEPVSTDATIIFKISVLGATYTASDFPIESQRYNDKPRHGDGVSTPEGSHLKHLFDSFRRRGAKWISGAAPTPSITTNVGTQTPLICRSLLARLRNSIHRCLMPRR